MVLVGGDLYKVIASKADEPDLGGDSEGALTSPYEKLTSLQGRSHRFICNICGTKIGRREGKYSNGFQECPHERLGSLEGGSHKSFCKLCGAKVYKRKNKDNSDEKTNFKKENCQKNQFCYKCGTPTWEDARFYHFCGEEIRRSTILQGFERNSQLQGLDLRIPEYRQGGSNKNSHGLMWVSQVGILVLVIGVAIVISQNSGFSSQSNGLVMNISGPGEDGSVALRQKQDQAINIWTQLLPVWQKFNEIINSNWAAPGGLMSEDNNVASCSQGLVAGMVCRPTIDQSGVGNRIAYGDPAKPIFGIYQRYFLTLAF